MTLLPILLISLAVWRIASLLARESGPGDVLDWLRHKIGVKHNERAEMYGTNMISKLVLCIWCSTCWLGMGAALLYYFAPEWALWLSLPFAISAAAILIERCAYGA